DVDCGGSCGGCGLGGSCLADADCLSGNCNGGVCAAAPVCGDGSCNGFESCVSCPPDCGECPIGDFYYVDVNTGSDSNPGTSVHPWKTIQKAADSLLAGDTVLIAPGIYREGMIAPANSGSEGSPITYKALDPNNPPMIVGTVRLDPDDWTVHDANIYKTTIGWEPKALYLGDVPLFIAQEPDQINPHDQMETDYFMKVPYNENNDSTDESHYQLVDSGFLTQPDDFWVGATMLLFDGDTNSVLGREVLDFISSENRLVVGYNQWALVGDIARDLDRYALRNHLSILDKEGEYYIDEGKLEVTDWQENPDQTLDVTVHASSAPGNIQRIMFFLINETSGAELTVNTDMQESETQTFTIGLAGRPRNLMMIFASVDLADAYDLYVWPYDGYVIEDVDISKEESAFDLNEYNKDNDYIIFDGLELKHYQGTALPFTAGFGEGTNRNGIVRNCDIHHNMLDGVSCRFRCEGLLVENCKLHNNYGQGISLMDGNDYVIQYNDVYGNLDNGIWVGMGGAQIYYVEDVVIRGNFVHHQGSARTHPDNIQLYKTRNVVVDGNYLLQEGPLQNTWFSANGPTYFINNIVVGGPAGINSANESYIYNNVFYESMARLDGGQDDPDYYVRHSDVKNNVFIDCILSMPPEHLWDNVIIDHNFYSVTGFYYSYWEDVGFGDGSILNPSASDPASLYDYFTELTDFNLRPDSELIDAGTDVSENLQMAAFPDFDFNVDHEGHPRPQGASWDIGAHEYP
ncbi:MAG: right-handed parallel beta-helix repeat-containing protein, partial [Candidatus Aenigmarchaeota archaeon]|nr:right-handed parallel beta-helix repeat-containing protein [Candidatus Aenigmarchaeota archaeon]